MADTKITDLGALLGSAAASTDLAVVVDVSDTSMAASGTTKKITLAELATAITTIGSLATDSEVSALSSVYQPLDSDLTAIAGLTTTAFGRGLLILADAAAGRTALDLGTIATQAANNVAITGGSVTGITDLAVADGGTGASDAATARTNLGLAAIASSASASDLTAGTVATARLGSGSASSSTFLRGDGTWAAPAPVGSTLYLANNLI